jgi:hypothetical protein
MDAAATPPGSSCPADRGGRVLSRRARPPGQRTERRGNVRGVDPDLDAIAADLAEVEATLTRLAEVPAHDAAHGVAGIADDSEAPAPA